MKIHKLMINHPSILELEGFIVFFRPFRSKLHRVVDVSNSFYPMKQKEIMQVLSTVCTRRHKWIWFFDFRDEEAEHDIMRIFDYMDVPYVFYEPESEDV